MCIKCARVLFCLLFLDRQLGGTGHLRPDHFVVGAMLLEPVVRHQFEFFVEKVVVDHLVQAKNPDRAPAVLGNDDLPPGFLRVAQQLRDVVVSVVVLDHLGDDGDEVVVVFFDRSPDHVVGDEIALFGQVQRLDFGGVGEAEREDPRRDVVDEIQSVYSRGTHHDDVIHRLVLLEESLQGGFQEEGGVTSVPHGVVYPQGGHGSDVVDVVKVVQPVGELPRGEARDVGVAVQAEHPRQFLVLVVYPQREIVVVSGTINTFITYS
jgi:hypothetical protein